MSSMQRVRSGKPSSGNRRPIERGTAPSSTRDPDRSQVNKELEQRDKRELISSFHDELDHKRQETERQVIRTVARIHSLKKDNERIQRKQVSDYGMTLDSVDDLKFVLDQTKIQNDQLYVEMAASKELHDKLDAELKNTKKKFDDAMEQLNKLENESRIWKATQERLVKTETRCQELMRNNKKLRIILLKNHVDPRTDAKELVLEADKDNDKANEVTKAATRHRHVTVKGRYSGMKSVESVRKINKDFLRKGFGMSDATFDQVSPAYLGYYVREFMEQENSREPEFPYREGVKLPRVFAKY